MYHYAQLEPPLWLNYSSANLELELYLTFGPDRSISLQSLLKSHTHGLQREPGPLSLSQVNGGLPQFLANTFTSEAMPLPLLFMQQPSTLKALQEEELPRPVFLHTQCLGKGLSFVQLSPVSSASTVLSACALC